MNKTTCRQFSLQYGLKSRDRTTYNFNSFFYVLFIFVLSPTFCKKNINFADLVTRSAHQKDVLSPLHLPQCNAVSRSLTITYQNVRKFLLDEKFFFYHFYEDFIISRLSIYIFFSGILRGSPERLERS